MPLAVYSFFHFSIIFLKFVMAWINASRDSHCVAHMMKTLIKTFHLLYVTFPFAWLNSERKKITCWKNRMWHAIFAFKDFSSVRLEFNMNFWCDKLLLNIFEID
jgi:hypothetical protein